MSNPGNLKTPTTSEARERGRKGGKASGEARRKRKALREQLEILLAAKHDGVECGQAVALALIEKALSGDVRAFEVIRDTIGEKPTDKIQADVPQKLIIKWSSQDES